jgi:hypothetical protein
MNVSTGSAQNVGRGRCFRYALDVSTKPCMTCSHGTRRPGGQKCEECWLRTQPIEVRQKAARLRSLAVPKPLHAERVPTSAWPAGRRWCAGCQSFVLLKDCGKTASRCRTCTSVSAHAGMIQRTYGITADEYAAIFKAQGGKCGICGGRPRSERLAIDHDHTTQEVRGLLCSRCNHELLGAAHDSLDLLRKAVAYMEEPPAGPIIAANRRSA